MPVFNKYCLNICGSRARDRSENWKDAGSSPGTINFYIILFKQRHLVCLIKASFHLFSGSEKTRNSKIGRQFFCSECHFKAVSHPFPKQRKSYVKDSELSFKKSQKSGRDSQALLAYILPLHYRHHEWPTTRSLPTIYIYHLILFSSSLDTYICTAAVKN